MKARLLNARRSTRMGVAKKRMIAGALAFGFIVVTLVAWWVFASLAETVVNCVPWRLGGACESPFTNRPRLQSGVRISMLIVSLIAAIWVANRLFYTAETYEPLPQPAPVPAPPQAPGTEKQ
jgi:hypothetical protein